MKIGGMKFGDGVAGMHGLPAGQIDLLFADLPAGITRAKFDRPFDLDAFWSAVLHCTKPNAAIVLMAANMRYAAKVVASNEKLFRYDLVWSKNKATGFLNAKRMPLRSHEFLLVFYRELPTYRPQLRETGQPMHAARQTSHGSNYGQKTQRPVTLGGATLRQPVSVLPFPIVNNDDPLKEHPQQKPAGLLGWVVESYTKTGDTVCDPCAGSGSMVLTAQRLGRNAVGFECDAEVWQRCHESEVT